MQKSIIYGLILSLLLVIFATQNSDIAEIHLYFWEISGPISMLIFGSFVFGVGLGILMLFPSLKRKKAELKKAQKSLEQFNVSESTVEISNDDIAKDGDAKDEAKN